MTTVGASARTMTIETSANTMTAPETSVITFGGTRVPYTIRRSARRTKTVAVSVDPRLGVLLAAPAHLTTPQLDAVVRRKARWIVERLRRAQTGESQRGPREWVSGEGVWYLGRHYRLKVHAAPAGDATLRGGWLHVDAPRSPQRADQVREAVVAWMRHHAARRFPERVQVWHQTVGVPMPRVLIADQLKRWGSCSATGTIRLNWRIIQAPLRVVDYVVVHELVHLRHRGHGTDYWHAVGTVMPDYERRRDELRRIGGRLEW